MFQSGDEFTKDLKRALKDLKHVALLFVTILIIQFGGNYLPEYHYWIEIALAFIMARSVSYTLVCSTAKMEFRQFTSPVLVFFFSFTSNYSLKQFTVCFSKSIFLRDMWSTQ